MAPGSHPVTVEQFLQAERMVIAGVVARLLQRYRAKYGEEHAAGYAMAVANVLFSLPPAHEKDQSFLEANRKTVYAEVQALKNDRVIREAVTETIAMRIVFGSRVKGCNAEDLNHPIDTLKQLGIFLPGKMAPSPKSFLQRAQAFFQASPRR
jgi:hypothetical protein